MVEGVRSMMGVDEVSGGKEMIVREVEEMVGMGEMFGGGEEEEMMLVVEKKVVM